MHKYKWYLKNKKLYIIFTYHDSKKNFGFQDFININDIFCLTTNINGILFLLVSKL